MNIVKAYPRKQFFIEMFTRDITLEDCILDLIDNSMDSYLRTRNIDITAEILGTGKNQSSLHPGEIRIDFSEDRFTITDNCGGIDRRAAEEEVFCFGHSLGSKPAGGLSVYGIGLKRAIFKLGNQTEVNSSRPNGRFKVLIDVPKWSQDKDDLVTDWTFPIEDLQGTAPEWESGTAITITDLHEEVKVRMRDGALEGTLRRVVAQTYSVFLREHLAVFINGVKVDRIALPLGTSPEMERGFEHFEEDSVSVTLLTTLAPAGSRKTEVAGWYVICNGRVVLAADKTEVTGWGGSVLPSFQPKYRPFVGVVLFMAEDPTLLPWTTSKRGLNRESILFQKTRARMAGLALPALRFLDGMYSPRLDDEQDDTGSEEDSVSASRAVLESVKQADFKTLLSTPVASSFSVRKPSTPRTSIRVQYNAELRELERIRKRLRRPSMAATTIGRHTFEHFLKTECPE